LRECLSRYEAAPPTSVIFRQIEPAHQPEFDLMAIGTSGQHCVFDFDNRVSIRPDLQANAFIGNAL
jgi:hypothetical protein